MRWTCSLMILGLAACASSAGPHIVKKPKKRIAQAGILGGQSIPAERDGVRLEDTGAIMFICSNSPDHEDKEVFISKCGSCSQENYFFWDYERRGFTCYACTKPFADEKVLCPDCGASPRTVRTRPKAKS